MHLVFAFLLANPICCSTLLAHSLVCLKELAVAFLNQVHAGLWLARAWFLKIYPVRIVGMHVRVCVYVCVCVCVRVCACVCVCVCA